MIKRSAIVALAMSLWASSSIAQETGSIIRTDPARIPDDYKMSDADRARATANAFAVCLLKRNPRGVERAAALPPGGPSGTAFARLATDECLDSGELRMPRELVRGSAFIALYRRDFGRSAPSLVATAPDYTASMTTDDDEMRQQIALRLYASCVIRHDVDHSRQFVLSPVAGSAERSALAALGPTFNACLTAGKTLHFSKAIMQGTLAEVLYRESVAPTAAARAGTK